MKKSAIWAIVALMSAAVMGVVWLQMDLIRMSIRVNEERFDKNVYYVLNEVAKQLEAEERREELFSSLSLNGFVTNYIQQERISEGNRTGQPEPGTLSTSLMLSELMEDPTVYALYGLTLSNRPLEERIKPQFLDAALRQAFRNRGMDPVQPIYAFHYGIFSYARKSLVFANGHFVVTDDFDRHKPAPGFKAKNLYNPDYAVALFPHDKPKTGELRVFFPNRNNIVWSSLWQNFLGSIFFTAIILFCFGYTLYVIFRQKQLSEMKTDFINNMTHEFKTPIATISLAADSITAPVILGNPEKIKRFANIIKQENNRMNNQVEKVLQMALIDKQEFALKLSEVNLHEVISAALENINLQVENRGGTTQGFLEAANPVVQADLTHVSSIINNLLDNANKYSPEKPEISVFTRNRPDGVEIIVKDCGIGMSKAELKHIFDKFYRVSTGNLHDIKGFGLGLSYVKAMMEAHKGQIDVKSELGKGSAFTLFFPFRIEAD